MSNDHLYEPKNLDRLKGALNSLTSQKQAMSICEFKRLRGWDWEQVAEFFVNEDVEPCPTTAMRWHRKGYLVVKANPGWLLCKPIRKGAPKRSRALGAQA